MEKEKQLALIQTSELFDRYWYCRNYLDVNQAGLSPEEHYFMYGAMFGRAPGPAFDPSSHPWIAREAAGKKLNPLVHHLLHGEDRATPERGEENGAFSAFYALQAGHAAPPTVSVVMTAYNAAEHLETSVRSVLGQSLRELELIVVDDASADDTARIAAALAEADPRVRLLRLYVNRGTYWAKNLGIHHARGRYIALHDSDDTSDPTRLARQVAALTAHPAADACFTNWVRTDENDQPILNRGRLERLGYPTLMARKALFATIGFFDSVRIAADDEFIKRIVKVRGRDAIVHLKTPLYRAPLRASSLTGRNPVLMEVPDPSRPDSFLSETRRDYVAAYSRWHASGDSLRLPFPLRERRFEAPEIAVAAFGAEERITASVASFPPRRAGLQRVVAAILPQVDRLRVHLNGYEDVPAFLEHSKITITRSQETGDLRDNGKFLNAEEIPPGIHVTLDDDLLYPANYVAYLAAKVLQYGGRAIVGLHATQIGTDFKRYHDRLSRTTRVFWGALTEDEGAHVLGTGTAAYHTSAIDFGMEHIHSTGMVDLWLAQAAQKQKVPMIGIARGKNWLTEMGSLPGGSLYTEYLDQDDPQTKLILDNMPWQIHAP